MIVEGCCESNWWRRGHNKTNKTQYGAYTSLMWCFFCSVLEQEALILPENSWMIVEGCCESNWWRWGQNKTIKSQYGANTSVMWCFFRSALKQKLLILLKILEWL